MNVFGDHPWLSGALVPLAWCWRIERRDGVTIGLTTHDRAMAIGGLTYHPEPGIRPSAIRQRRGLGDDSVDIEGAISSGGLSAADLASGRWNGARLDLIVADWEAPEARHVLIVSGRLAGVRHDGVAFTAELSGRDPRLDRKVAPETSAECRAELGDARCRVALASRTHRSRAVAVAGRRVTMAVGLPAGTLAFGRLRWLSGAARGLGSAILADDGEGLTLAQACAGAAAGDAFELVEGCDKRAATCSGRFHNIANFQGEPHLPGIDLLTRFPGS